MTAKTVELVIQHNSMQFSDNKDQHKHDADAVFDIAVDTGAWIVTGTESGASPVNHDLRELLMDSCREHGFHGFFHQFGDWVAFNTDMLRGFDHGFDGPYIAGTHGLKASEGGHSPRGTTWMSGYAKDHDLGLITAGAGHWLTGRSMGPSGTDNDPMVKGVSKWARQHGKGSKLVFYNADTNEHDDKIDVFKGNPLTTLADELKKHPKTHGVNTSRGSAIDIISSYDPDRRVSGKDYRVWDDRKHKLFSDHFILHGVYTVRERSS